MKRNKIFAALGVTALAGALVACGSSDSGGGTGTGSGGLYTIGTTDVSVTSIDPAGAYDLPSWTIQYNIYQQLVTYAPGGNKPVPSAAKSCDYTDAKTVKCVLQDGLKFSNGNSLTSEDVKFSFQRSIVINDSNGASSLLADLSDGAKKPDLASNAIETPDPQTVVFHLAAPDQTFIQALTTPAASIIDHTVFPADQLQTDPTQMIGSGPYTLDQYKPNEQAVFVANDQYTGDNTPKTKTVILKYFKTDSSLTQAMSSQSVDVGWRTFSPTELNSFKDNSKVQVLEGTGAEFRYYVWHMQDGPGKSLAVRQAAAQLMDRDAIVQKAYDGTVKPAYSIVPQGFVGATEAFKDAYGDPSVSKAKAILQKAGVKTPISIKLGYPTGHYPAATVDDANEYAAQLNASGLFKAKVTTAEWNSYQNLEKQGAYDLFLLGWFPDYLDSDDYLSPFIKDGGFFVNGYSNPKVNKLLAKERGETNQGKRVKEFEQLQQIVAHDVPLIPTWTGINNAVATTDMSGVKETLDSAYIFRMWLPSKG
ncbi:MAG: ABC transporter substrate-binding protein [Nocardioides sp.]